MTSYNVTQNSQQPLTTKRVLDSYINRQFADAVLTIYRWVRLVHSQTQQNKCHEEQCKDKRNRLRKMLHVPGDDARHRN